MFITEVKLIKSDIPEVNKKLRLAIAMGVVFLLSALIAIAYIIYSIIVKVTDYTPYLFAGFALLISIFWIMIIFTDYKKFKLVFADLMENGAAVLKPNQVVNAEKKTNNSTIVNFVCSAVVFACLVLTIVLQILHFNLTELAYVVLLFPLFCFLVYQSFSMLINDKLYRNCILGEDVSKK